MRVWFQQCNRAISLPDIKRRQCRRSRPGTDIDEAFRLKIRMRQSCLLAGKPRRRIRCRKTRCQIGQRFGLAADGNIDRLGIAISLRNLPRCIAQNLGSRFFRKRFYGISDVGGQLHGQEQYKSLPTPCHPERMRGIPEVYEIPRLKPRDDKSHINLYISTHENKTFKPSGFRT
jgi:hypothetical protein